jgi:hypothetical protein
LSFFDEKADPGAGLVETELDQSLDRLSGQVRLKVEGAG